MTDIPINPIIVPSWARRQAAIHRRKPEAARSGARAGRAGLPGISFSEIGDSGDGGDMMPGAQTPFADIHILDLGPEGANLAPEDAIFAPSIRTITLNILASAPADADLPLPVRLAFMPLHPLPSHIIPPPARLRIRLTAASRQKLLLSTLGRTIIGDHIEIPELLGSIGGITLAPGETLPIVLEYETDYLDEGSALRVLQYAGEADSERLTGVQIYVFTGMSR